MSSTTPSSSKARSGLLDLLRFLAVLMVFLAHYTDTFNYTYRIVPANFKYIPVTRYALPALLVLFIISGYVVTMTSMKRSLKDFLIIRLSRIYPLFWVSCVVAFMLPRIISDNHSYLALVRGKTLLANLTMMPFAFGYQLLNPVFHTLMTELLFYIFIAFIILFKLWNRVLIVIAVALGLCVANIFYLDFPAYAFLTPLFSGMLFYLIRAKYASPWILYTLLAVSFGCALMCAHAFSQQLNLPSSPPESYNIWVFVGIITGIYALFLGIALDKIHLKTRPLFEVMSDITYAFYLFHVYFLFFYWYFSDKVQADLLLVGILLATLLTSWILNRFVEKPLSQLTFNILTFLTGLFRKRDVKLQNQSSS